jgi:hypothetical protein
MEGRTHKACTNGFEDGPSQVWLESHYCSAFDHVHILMPVEAASVATVLTSLLRFPDRPVKQKR